MPTQGGEKLPLITDLLPIFKIKREGNMKAVIEYELDYELDAEKYRCSQKAYEMSGLIDSFLDYLSIHLKLPKKSQPSLQNIYDMYCSKIVQQGLEDMVDDDVRYLLDEFTQAVKD